MLSDSPPERNLEWSNNGIEGAKKFILKIWRYFNNIEICHNEINNDIVHEKEAKKLEKNMHFCIDKVTKSLENFQYNVAVASLREFSNHFLTIKDIKKNKRMNNILFEALSNWVIMLAPLMPHFAEELWKILGNKNTLVTDQKWPKADISILQENKVNLIIQVNGKKKDVLNIEKGLSKEVIKGLAVSFLKNQNNLKEKKVKKIIVVPDRIVNIVI